MSDFDIRITERASRANPGDAEAQERAARVRERAPLPESTPDYWEGEGRMSKPMIGMAVTHGAGSDCYPATVVAVSKTGHSIEIRDNRHSYDRETKTRSYFPGDPEQGTTTYIRKRSWKRCDHCSSLRNVKATTCLANGNCRVATRDSGPQWRPVYTPKGSGFGRWVNVLCMGYRRYYQDPHF